MTRKQIVCTVFTLALAILLGASLASAGEVPHPSSVPQPQVTAPVPLPLSLTTPAGESCSGVSADDNLLLGITLRECTGCSFEPPSFCDNCCGRAAACIDTMDGGYCTC